MSPRLSTFQERASVPGILLLYHRPARARAPTIVEHIAAFARHSRFRIWEVNTSLGFPRSLAGMRFEAIVLHYTLFCAPPYWLDAKFLRFLQKSDSYKIAFFQDEHHFCRTRFAFLNAFEVDCVYTLLEPAQWDAVYRRHTKVAKLVHTLPGYVSDEMIGAGRRFAKPDAEREIDIGYRGRSLDLYMGRGAREKAEIGFRMRELLCNSPLKVDIEIDEESRVYGDGWYEFLGNCRGTLGTEAGVSIFDLDDSVRSGLEALREETPEITFDEASERLLAPWEDNIYYRTISPRHFEAAALRVCQILFEGRYSGILEPFVHYLPLKKDFSNFDDVMRMFADEECRLRLTAAAHRHLIESGRYSYERFIRAFDDELEAIGLRPEGDRLAASRIGTLLERDRMLLSSISQARRSARTVLSVLYGHYRRRPALRFVLGPLFRRMREFQAARKARRMETALGFDPYRQK